MRRLSSKQRAEINTRSRATLRRCASASSNTRSVARSSGYAGVRLIRASVPLEASSMTRYGLPRAKRPFRLRFGFGGDHAVIEQHDDARVMDAASPGNRAFPPKTPPDLPAPDTTRRL